MNTPITFKGYQIQTIKYSQTQEENVNCIEPSFNPEVNFKLNKTEDKAIVDVSVDIEADKRKLEVSVLGFFDLNKDFCDDMEELKRYLVLNGGAIILPYVRSISSMVTALDSSQSFVLPTVNIEEVLKKQNEEQE